MRIRYTGPARGAHHLKRQLAEAGVHVDFPPPLERRGVGQDIVHITMTLANQAEGGLVGGAALLAAQRAAKLFRERHAGIEAEVERTQEDEDPPSTAGYL